MMVETLSWQSAMLVWGSGCLFAVFHSVTASQGCKQWFYRHGLTEPRYRLVYSIISVMTTAAWIWWVHGLSDTSLYAAEGWLWFVLVGLQVLGLLIVLAAFQPIDGLAFLGIHQSKQGNDPFIIQGIYHYLRHPMYSGAMLLLLAMPEQTWLGLNLALCMCMYFIVGSKLEEDRMLEAHPEYADYQHQVSAFVPSKFWKRGS